MDSIPNNSAQSPERSAAAAAGKKSRRRRKAKRTLAGAFALTIGLTGAGVLSLIHI